MVNPTLEEVKYAEQKLLVLVVFVLSWKEEPEELVSGFVLHPDEKGAN